MGDAYIHVKGIKMKTTDLTELNNEIEQRIEEMEKEDYEFPRRFSKTDYIITAVVATVCLIMIICGAFIG